jgi:ribosome-binding factor A
VEKQLLKETSFILKGELKDPRIGFVTLTHAQLSSDLKRAKIFVSIMGTRLEQQKTLNALEHASGFIRSKIAERIRLRHIPDLVFIKDDTSQKVERVLQILSEIESKEKKQNDN